MSEKIVLVDGHSILNRAFYGVPDLTNAQGLHTNAIYGFLNILFKILEEEQAKYLTVAFDVHAPTFRHEIYAEYKGTRKPMPTELREQIPVMKEVLKAMGILTVEKAGLEADDILGTLAKKAEKEGMEVSLVSGDRDLLQIASEHIKIRIPKTKGGKTEIEDYYAGDVEKTYQVNPKQFIELKALMGDTADNIPGVPKVGQKTATDLMITYGSIDAIYEHLDDISKKSIRESLANNRNLADLSLTLATINISADFEYSFDHAKLQNLYTEEAYQWFKKLEFKNLLNKYDKQVGTTDVDIEIIEQKKQADAFFAQAKKKTMISCRCYKSEGKKTVENQQMVLPFMESESDGKLNESGLIGVAVTIADDKTAFIKVNSVISEKDILTGLNDCIKNNVELAVYQAKEFYEELKNIASEPDTKQMFDVCIAAYLLNPLKNDYQIEDIANEYPGMMLPSFTQSFGKKTIGESFLEQEDAFIKFASMCSMAIWKSVPLLKEQLRQTEQEKLFNEIEMPLSLVLFHMEQEGVLVKPQELKNYGEALMGRISELEASIHEQAGVEFNINSPKQLGELLFEKMQIPGGKKTKTGYSTAADVLEKLSAEYPIVSEILEYRGLTKLKSTYADGLANFIGNDNRIHTTFNQTITATGRISSTDPNLQNIPMKTELGRKIRKVFVPKAGYVLMDADYSQIELRVLASLSGDERLIEAYRQEADIHRMTAALVFGVKPEEVTPLQRRNAKAVNFGIVYGISSFGLSQDLSISRKEAAAYIASYFETYPKIKEYLDKCVEEAKKEGYSITAFGRRRPLPELSSSNFMQRSFGERVAMNAPIQGTAADIIKIAMIRVDQKLRQDHLKSKLILQVHDELVIETAKDEIEKVREILSYEMQHAADLAVQLEIDLNVGDDWYDAH